jgi:hypothetical protein
MYQNNHIKTGDFIFITMSQPIDAFSNIVASIFSMSNRTTCAMALWLDMNEYDNENIVIVPGYQDNAKMFYYHVGVTKDYDYIDRIITSEAILCDLSVYDRENICLEYRPLSNSITPEHRVNTMYAYIEKYHHRQYLFSRDPLYKISSIYKLRSDDNEENRGMCTTFTGLYYDMLSGLEYPWNKDYTGKTTSAFRLIPSDHELAKLQSPLFKNKIITYYRRGDVPKAAWMNIYFITFVIVCLVILLLIVFIWSGIVITPKIASLYKRQMSPRIIT